jgi:hypothetical protein
MLPRHWLAVLVTADRAAPSNHPVRRADKAGDDALYPASFSLVYQTTSINATLLKNKLPPVLLA